VRDTVDRAAFPKPRLTPQSDDDGSGRELGLPIAIGLVLVGGALATWALRRLRRSGR
jgi:hypothetical protein